MGPIIAGLAGAASSAALAVIARLISQKMFEKLFEALIKQGVQYLADHTESPVLDQVAAIVKAELDQPSKDS
jgi:hypothetical protein